METTALICFDCQWHFANHACCEYRAPYFCGCGTKSSLCGSAYLDNTSCCHTFFLFCKIIHL